ncbi:MAG: RNA polymerase sigma factor [Acidimicrobiia bacterium]
MRWHQRGDMQDEAIYRKHADELVRFATGLVGPFDAADVVADACMAAFRSSGWNGVSEQRAYLYRAVLNQARMHHRSTLRRRLREQRAAVRDTVSDREPDLDVLAAIERLSLQQRAVVMLTYWEDLPIDEVSRRLAISEGAVKKQLARARARLREWLA